MSKDHARRYLEGLPRVLRPRRIGRPSASMLVPGDWGYREAGDLGDFGRGQMQRPFEEATSR